LCDCFFIMKICYTFFYDFFLFWYDLDGVEVKKLMCILCLQEFWKSWLLLNVTNWGNNYDVGSLLCFVKFDQFMILFFSKSILTFLKCYLFGPLLLCCIGDIIMENVVQCFYIKVGNSTCSFSWSFLNMIKFLSHLFYSRQHLGL
jgi:TM2 domain-containing membrane protein YozV